MGIFNKTKKADPVTKYAGPEQVPTGSLVPSADDQFAEIRNNHKILVQNQQTILDAIVATQQLLMQAVNGDLPPSPPEPEELSEEEMRAAVMMLREQKKKAGVVKKK